jgi:uncharacterized protein YdbL (DUF1318 family)
MNRIISALALTTLLASPALALDLKSARSGGLVCEGSDGFIAAVGAPSKDVGMLVASVNEGRAKEYAKISSANGQSPAVVGALAAEQLIAKGNRACK